jgi:uncharacterized protein (DUF983 family)
VGTQKTGVRKFPSNRACGRYLMTIETNKPTNRTINAYVDGMSNRFNKRRIWIRCPRCIGGNMYQERNGKYVCIQCGSSYYPEKVDQTPIEHGIL